MILNIKRFAPELGEYNPEYNYTYTKKGYVATVEVSIECDYDISSIELSRGETLLGDLVDVTSDWTLYNDGSSIKRTFTKPCHDTFIINFENATKTGYVIVNTSDDFTPESEQYPVEINGDIKIANTTMKLKNMVDTIQNIADIIYPIGSIYISAAATDPGTLFGGTWVQLKNHFLFATNATSGNKGKDAVSSHTGTNVTGTAISTDQMPSHTHNIKRGGNYSSNFMIDSGKSGQWGSPIQQVGSYTAQPQGITVENTGGGKTHNHGVSYIEVYVWQRTA